VGAAKQHAYCGLHCGTCVAQQFNFKLRVLARELKRHVDNAGFESWMPEVVDFDFHEFHKGHEHMAELTCPGCREGGGPPQCGTRLCAQRLGVTSCLECTELPTCEHMEYRCTTFPTTLEDWALAGEKGLEAAWSVIERRAQESGNSEHVIEISARVTDITFK